MLDIYELPKRIACSYAFSDACSFIVGALGMTSCEQNAWEDDTKHNIILLFRKSVTRVSRPCV